ncbi:MAG: nuclease A inhibitor family protein [Cyanobacteria bacterium P01_F01_bin.53]
MSNQSAQETTLREQLETACDGLWWSSESDYPVEVVWQPSQDLAGTNAGIDFTKVTSTHDEPIRRWIADYEGGNGKEGKGKGAKPLEDREIACVHPTEFFTKATVPKSWHTQEDKAQLAQLQQLRQILEGTLSHLKIYRFGEVEVSLYILGLAPGDILAGVKTTLIETWVVR